MTNVADPLRRVNVESTEFSEDTITMISLDMTEEEDLEK
jgi:hypothetical protein